MFVLRPLDSGEWSVVDASGEPLFSGPLRDCEEWLDRREALAGGHVGPGLFRRSAAWVRSRLAGILPHRPASGARGPRPVD